MKIIIKMKDILKKLGINKKEYVPIEPYRGSNMYDFFVKKTIDNRLLNKNKGKQQKIKNIHEYDGDDKIDWNSTYEGPKIRKFVIPVNGLSRKEEVNRVYSELDPYGEENWNDDDIQSFNKDYSYRGNQINSTNFGLFNNILRGLSTMFGGLEYNDMKIRNSYARELPGHPCGE